MKVTFDQIEPNISDVDVDGARVEVTWKCPASGRDVATSGAAMLEDAGLKRQVSTAVKRTLLIQLMMAANKALASVFGTSVGAELQSTTYAANALVTQEATKVRFSEAAKNAAIVEAFKQVADKFEWDEDREQYVARRES